MGDIQNPTSNVTIYDEDGYRAEVTTDNELMVYDAKANTDRDRYDWLRYIDENKAFVASVPEIEINSITASFFLLNNPVGANKTLFIKRIYFNMHKDDDDGVKSGGTLYLYYGPTVTSNGTAFTPRNLKTRATTSVVSTYYLPTTTANGTLFDKFFFQDGNVFDNYGLVINPGEVWLGVVEPAKKPRNTEVSIYWGEE